MQRVTGDYLSPEEQSIWAFQNHVSPSSELPGCRGGRTEGWSAAVVQSESPSEEPSVRTAELDTDIVSTNIIIPNYIYSYILYSTTFKVLETGGCYKL